MALQTFLGSATQTTEAEGDFTIKRDSLVEQKEIKTCDCPGTTADDTTAWANNCCSTLPVQKVYSSPSAPLPAVKRSEPESLNPCVSSGVQLPGDQYTLYATYYQWYYRAMRDQERLMVEKKTKPTVVEERPPDSKHDWVTKWMRRPARQQIHRNEASRYSHTEGGTEYNIWYGKYLTDRYNRPSYLDRETAPYKCDPKRDAGYTKANTDASGEHFFCIYFARGGCCLGKDCRFRHSIPTADDEGHLEWGHDVFGRERFSTHKDDMDGVGSFNHDCKTLFVSGFRIDPEVPDGLKKMEVFLSKEFGTWGDVTCIRVIPKKNIAFITYAYRVQAEFAKVAMADQNLGKQAPLLLVKWAHHDGNANKRRLAEQEQEEDRKRQKQPAAIGPGTPTAGGEGSHSLGFLPEGPVCGDAAADATALSATLEGHCKAWQHFWSEFAQTQRTNVAERHQQASLRDDGFEDWAVLYERSAENEVDAAPRPLAEMSANQEADSSAAISDNLHNDIEDATEALARMQHILSRVDGLDDSAFEVRV
ncbi:pre-mRNA splicing factor CWC2, related [Neospora caninum Liverpool]|uniref:Pre-mRNA splicing factor CWC2, related n=1 Tax=Neospora caninum (strain Liverpool) TaxID=572307 RepID=F0VBD6_NEOCL|nr:pre-mRNA splicing factor CWC2, related [Neospora caninum Liverpool]CBZ50920.1 pre-mRNA splicing factor CWC2, related [Neospora caninum Liverpool]CEL68221.1 TPA: Pre-mRNA splicing factor CWC2, related [Neospora caninum Liverpool]|eukprot:XP_003880953.1 pre-mRNA splicing factor CWC2, related [Neospora caninum Liverpool]